MSGIEDKYLEGFVARRASREKQIQQHYRPVISVHKWFARRPGSLFRALAVSELADGSLRANYERGHQLEGVCLDPFMGGGTPLFEAARLGMSVVGFDTNPMARWIVERELEDVDPDELARIGGEIADKVEAEVADLYTTSCPDCHGDARARYFLWVRQHVCAECGMEHSLLSDTQIVSTKLGRHPREVHVCPHCLDVSEHKPGKRPARCRGCKGRYDSGLIPSDTLLACACGTPYRIPPQGTVEEPRLRLIAIDYDCKPCSGKRTGPQRAYKQPETADFDRVTKAERLVAETPSPFWPQELIPNGTESARLLRWGYNRWIELFSARQLHGLGLLAARISEQPDGPIKRALQTVFSDLLRYQNLLCRYDRQALKPTDIFAVHGFPVPRVACEVALLGEQRIGSGGFRHGLSKYVRAKQWCREPYELTESGRKRTAPEVLTSEFVSSPDSLGTGGRAYLRRGSLGTDELPADSVDIVLTDPPYFANVQYGELMNFCYVWLRRLAPDTPFFDIPSTKTDDDAVGSIGGDPVDIVEFTRRLSSVFENATRALKPGAPFCFTYHHNELEAYAPVAVACLDAGLVPTAVFGCPSEMRSSTHIHQRNASTVDTLFVLRKPPTGASARRDLDDVDGGVRRHLAAIRRAGLRPTEADRECLRSGQITARAIYELTDGWSQSLDAADRFALVVKTLRRVAGLPEREAELVG
ncbi:MAG TPA: hypothetical protein VNJ54_01310 [Plantibacter sp.]|uniref:hypothetical protein n=1 Tax=Plantibacter sp. TaxID=1871045 RepID=UPI002BF6B944|nr:hypothetical protein [Plantibacter sp.]